MKKFKNKFSVISICALIFSLILPSGANAAETNDVSIQSEVGAAVYGGTTASITDAPWQVAITLKSASNEYDGFFCGGSLISNQWIITAAHCLVDDYDSPLSPSSLLVHVGSSRLSTSAKATRAVSAVRVHDGYDSYTAVNDIALLKLTNPVTFAPGTIEAIDIAASDPYDGEIARITGWGEVRGATYPATMQKGNITIQAGSVCENSYYDFYTSSQICGGDASTDVCSGDSGGPLTHTEAGKQSLIGLVSYGSASACASGTPSAFTRVSFYRSWIQSQIGEFSVVSAGVINTGASSSSKVTITSATPRTVELVMDVDGSDHTLQTNVVLSWVASISKYQGAVLVQSTNYAFDGVGPGSYPLSAVDLRTSEEALGTIAVSDGIHSSATLTLDATEYFPSVDGYRDVIAATLSVLGASNEPVPFTAGQASITVGAKTARCTFAASSSGVATCNLNLKGFSATDEVTVTANFTDGAGNSDTVESQIVALLTTQITSASISRDVPTVFPASDGYIDTVQLPFTMETSTGRSIPLTKGSITVKLGTKVAQTWPLTKSASSYKTWNGLNGGKIVPGSYTIVLVAQGAEGRSFTSTAVVVVSNKKLTTKTTTVSYTGKEAFRYYYSDDSTACQYDGTSFYGYTYYIDSAICYSYLAVPTAVQRGYANGAVQVKATLVVFDNIGDYCASFGIDEASGADVDICTNGTKVLNMGRIASGSSTIQTYMYLPYSYTMLHVRSLTLTYTYKSLG